MVFRGRRHWVGVEVKTSLSTDADLVRGLFQCVKYTAVTEACQVAYRINADFRAVLALESALPADLIPLRNTLGIDTVESVGPTLSDVARASARTQNTAG